MCFVVLFFGHLAARVGSAPVLSLSDECDFPHVATRISSA